MAKIMLVDDEQGICELMRYYFKVKGYEVIASGTCKQAISLAKAENPDIMLLDRVLPDGDGLSLLQEIRKFNPALKVIVVSAYDIQPEDTKRMKDLGVLQFIRKPVIMDELIEMLKGISS